MAIAAQHSDDEVSDAARIRIFGRLSDAWGLTGSERATLLGAAQRTFHRWKSNPEAARLSRDQRSRITYLVNMFVDARTIFDDDAFADSWIRRPNSAFGGKPAIEVLMNGTFADLVRIGEYLHRGAGG